MVYMNGSEFFSREMVKYYNSCPECYSRCITTLYTEMEQGLLLNRRTKKAVDEDDVDYRIHKSCLYCEQCRYYDFPDAFREREIRILPMDHVDYLEYDEVYNILRMRYIGYLRKKFSLNDPRMDAYRVQEKEG